MHPRTTSDWSETTLGECADWFSGGTPNTAIAAYWDGDIPWITASSLHYFYLEDSERRITEIGLQNGSRLMPEDTIIFVVRGMSLKTEFRVGVAMRPMAFGQDCKAIVAKNGVNPLFLANVLRAKAPDILELVDEASHGTGRLQTPALQQLRIPLPPLPEQRAIAHILGTLDDKIELNQRMNETLEAMARAIFKSWFVDFDPVRAKARGEQPAGLAPEIAALFPDTLVETELGRVPEGWEIGSFLELADLLSGGTPSTSEPEYWNGDIPWVSAKDVSGAEGSFLLKTEKTITRLGLQKSSTKILPAHTTIITARGTVGSYRLLGAEMAMNQTNYGLRARNGAGDYFIFFSTAQMIEHWRQQAYGTIFDTITTKTFRDSR